MFKTECKKDEEVKVEVKFIPQPKKETLEEVSKRIQHEAVAEMVGEEVDKTFFAIARGDKYDYELTKYYQKKSVRWIDMKEVPTGVYVTSSYGGKEYPYHATTHVKDGEVRYAITRQMTTAYLKE